MPMDLWLAVAIVLVGTPAGLCVVLWRRLRDLKKEMADRTVDLAARLEALERRAEASAPCRRLDARASKRLLERLLKAVASVPPSRVGDLDDSKPEDLRRHATTSNE